MDRVIELVSDLDDDICVLTGDFRAKTFGPFDAALDGVARVRACLKGPLYGVLGNHDTVRMVPALENMGMPAFDRAPCEPKTSKADGLDCAGTNCSVT